MGVVFITSTSTAMLLAIVLLLLLVSPLLLLFISPWRNLAFPKKEQRTAIKAVYDGKDGFICLPTGYS